MQKIRLLFLAANPDGTQRLALDQEARSIEERIRAAKFRDSIELITKWAVRPDDLLQALNEHQPHVVHFSAHGAPTDEILLEGDDRQPHPVGLDVLRSLFGTLKDNVRLVVLNACYSQDQADAITEHIDCAIGMGGAIPDPAAIDFAASLYRAIGFGRTVQNAFEQGVVSLRMKKIEGDQLPELKVRTGVDADEIVLVEPNVDEKPGAAGMSPGSEALTIWKERLAYLQRAEAMTADANQRFALAKQIEDIQDKIREFGG